MSSSDYYSSGDSGGQWGEFSSEEWAEQVVEEWADPVVEEWAEPVAESESDESESGEVRFQKFIPYSVTDIEETGTTTTITIGYDRDIGMIELFDHIRPSETAPIVCLKQDEIDYFKVYKKADVNKEWLEEIYELPDGLYVRMLITKKIYKKKFINLHWPSPSKLEYNIKFEKGVDRDDILKRIGDVLDINHNVAEETQSKLSVKYSITNTVINKPVLCDYIMNVYPFYDFFYLDELVTPSLEKKRFYIKFDYGEDVKITSILTQSGADILVSIISAGNMDEISLFQKYLHILLFTASQDPLLINQYYLDERVALESKTAKSTGGMTELNKIMYELEKGGRRDLIEKVFIKRGKDTYSRRCQKGKQPSVVSEEIARKMNPDKVIKFEGVNFICNHKDYPYPGLISTENEYGYAPCCFKKNQKKHARSRYNEYISNISIRKQESSYIIGKEKIAFSRMGELSITMKRFFDNIGLKHMLRMGVPESVNSVIHCMEMAFGKRYDVDDRHIREIRLELLNYVDSAQQEFYDLDMVEYINSVGDFLDPTRAIRLLENYYDCNIVMFFKNDFIFPRSSIAHFKKNFRLDKPFIFLLLQPYYKYRYQVEIFMSSYMKKFEIHQFNYENFSKLYDMALEVKTIGIRYETPEEVFARADKQYVDSNGKVRIFYFGNISLFTQPCPPNEIPTLPKPIITPIDYEEFKIFAEDNDIEVKMQHVKNGGLVGVLTEVGYVPIVKRPPLNGITSTPLGFKPQFEDESPSNYQLMKNNKRVAMFLKNYSLYFYVQNDRIDENDFEVIDDYDYRVHELDSIIDMGSTIVQGGKIIVPTQRSINALLHHVEVIKTNFPSVIEYYKEHTSMPDYYQSIDDFILREDQIVFLNIKSLMKYLDSTVGKIEVVEQFDSKTKDPYVIKVDDDLAIIQNVRNGSIEASGTVSDIWERFGYNSGYKTTESSSDGHILKYKGVSEYAAILFL